MWGGGEDALAILIKKPSWLRKSTVEDNISSMGPRCDIGGLG